MSNSKEEIKKKLKEILLEKLKDEMNKDEEFNIEENENLASIGLNSMTFIQVVVQCEEEFNIEFDDEELDYEVFDSLETLAECIEKKMKQV